METFLRLHLEPYAGVLQKEFCMAERSEIVEYYLLAQLASVNGWATGKEEVSGAWLRCRAWEQAVFAILEVWILGRKLSIPFTICQILLRIWPFAFPEISTILLWTCREISWRDLFKTTKDSFSDQVRFPSRIFPCNYYCEFRFASLNACQGRIKRAVE